jgi:hypothetical protein
MHHEGLRSVLASVALMALLLVGCDTTLEPFAENNGAYSVRGVLTLTQDTHYIRVKNLNQPISEDAPELDATVTLENLTTGLTETLEDSVVLFEGVATHNFRVDQSIEPSADYRLTVERSDGVTTQATATTPPFTEVDVAPETTAVACDQEIILDFPNVPTPRLLRLRAAIEWEGIPYWRSIDITTRSDGTPTAFVSAASVIADVVPAPTLETLGGASQYCTILSDDTLPIAYTHFGPDWPADSVRADPLASDVENGLGLFGAMHRDTLYKTVYVPDS